jgi:hypothetical protein
MPLLLRVDSLPWEHVCLRSLPSNGSAPYNIVLVAMMVKLIIMTPWRRTGGVKVYTLEFLTSALDEDEWPTSCPRHYIPGEMVPRSNCLGSRMGHRAGLNTTEKAKISLPRRKSSSKVVTAIVSTCTSSFLVKTWSCIAGLICGRAVTITFCPRWTLSESNNRNRTSW